MRILFITNYPSPYRVDFFNLLGQKTELTVAFTESTEEQKHRSRDWFNENYYGFKPVFLKKRIGTGRAVLCVDIIKLLRCNFDIIITGGYASATQMFAIEYMKIHRIPFCMEFDGGLIKDDNWLKYHVKKHYISAASYWISSSDATSDYCVYYGADRTKIYKYPFTSFFSKDILAAPVSHAEKLQLRQRLGIQESTVIIGVGQLIHRKGFDILMRAAVPFPKDIGIYIIGGEPPEEYKQMRKELALEHVHFIKFKVKEELKNWYKAADLFVMPTREDIWGLVVNEAMSYGLPVVSTDQCGAALELVADAANGFVIPAENPLELRKAILKVLSDDLKRMGESSLRRIRPYTIEKMVEWHVQFFNRIWRADR